MSLGLEDSEIQDEWQASFFVDNAGLVIDYYNGENTIRNVFLEFQNSKEKEIVEKILQDVNFWAQIVNALSAALTQQKEQIIGG